MEPVLISRPEAAKALNISVDTLDRLVKKGHIQRLKIGTRTCYAKNDVYQFSEELKRKGAIKLA